MRSLIAASCLVSMTALCHAQQASDPKHFAIPAQSVSSALKAFAEQSALQLIFTEADVGTARTLGVNGDLAPAAALDEILKGTNLEYEITSSNVVVVRKVGGGSQTGMRTRPNEIRLAQNDIGGRTNASPATAAPVELTKLEEIVVTAQKRTERLQDVPVPVTAVNTEMLVARGEVSVQDYYAKVPGLNLTMGTGAQDAPVLSIRGVTTGGSGFGGNPTVGIVVDDQPYGSTSSLGGGNLMPDLDPSDLARIEVLRGPQGTLYGASSIGGLLKYVTVAPSTEAFTGRLQAGTSAIENADEPAFNVRGAVNVPVSDSVAVRASGFYRFDAGYIDDPSLGIDGVNEGEAYGGRISALLNFASSASLRLSAVVQSGETQGQSAIHVLPGLHDLEQSYEIADLGGYTRDSYIYSAILNAGVGSGELTSITGYSVNEVRGSLDRSAAFGSFMEAPNVAGVSGAAFVESFSTKKFSQEVRLDVPLSDALDLLIGGFYTKETSDFVQDIEAVDTTNSETVSVPYHNPFESEFEEYAGFADLTARFTDRFDVQFGGRFSRNEQSLSARFEGALMPVFGIPSGLEYPEERSRDSSFTYLITPRFKMTPDIMIYGRLASGYRPGGPNANAAALGVPDSFDADRTQNYELGMKGSVADDAVAFDLSLYVIDWKDIQLQLSDPLTSLVYFGNGGKAQSRGAEFSVELRPWRGGTVASWVAWNDAELVEHLPPGPSLGLDGDRLPFSSRWSANAAIDQGFDLFGTVAGSIGATITYVDERLGTFTDTSARERLPSYTQVDLRAGIEAANWTVDLFAKNVGDERGVLAGGLGTAQPFAYKIILPRTIGINIATTF